MLVTLLTSRRSTSLRPHRAAVVSLLLSLAVLAALLVAPGRAAHATPPPNPTNGQISNAQQQKAALAAEVGRLGAEVAQAENQLRQLEASQELAEQKLAYALSKLEIAKQDSQVATQAVNAAKDRVTAAKQQFRSYVQATYMTGGDIGGTTGSLLTANDPNVVLQQSALQNYESDHQLDAIGNLKSATVAKSNADAKAKLAVEREKAATDDAAQAKKDADDAVMSARAQKQQLDGTLAANRVTLQRAQEKLATLNNQRAAYLAYQREQARLRAIALAKQRAAEARARAAAAHARAVQAAEEKAAAAADRRREAANRQHHRGGGGSSSGSSSGSSNGGSSGGGFSAPAPHPSGGGWSASRGANAVSRAMRYLGYMYAWAGGDSSGPTYGVCAGDGAFNDCHIRGFDCSGLTLYGWAPYTRLTHYTVVQYNEGSVHPSLGNLRKGDLLFWSSNGQLSGVHHVAMYIGGGNVIQAPQSGSVIQITPVGDVSWGYYGATRPLT